MDTAYRFGIEEEYFLADAATRGTPAPAVLEAFHAAAGAALPRVERELLRTQVEASSAPAADCAAARAELSGLRRGLATLARQHGLLVFAAGTHPLAHWTRQSHTEKERYQDLARQLGLPGARNMVGGLHVHVEVPRPETRVDLMNRLMPFLPLLLALSASSPFFGGRATGLAAYRLCVFGEMPRTGLPELFADAADYERLVRAMTGAGAIPDASYLWWVVRPSLKYPTLELRVADSCTRLADSLAIAALWRCLVRCADRRPDLNRGMTGASRAIAGENLWRAQRDGAKATFVEEATGEALPAAAWLDQAIALVGEDAAALGCGDEVAATRAILAGTSADRQAAVFEQARARGLAEDAALAAVVDWLAAATAECGQGGTPSAGAA
ncbi:carboxylate-amine ligase [Paracraurococcus ruber]|uniref:Putative glutamate--cysteine ligase 2 n=1 Tax=Paracraurococcus ruber TaxID=77675 RepID=A0ABS1D1T9_9PROT|nr:carboxylate-amine ligase [Paracraurococcus ruber]MBK1660794.1 carboxylate-amine ligase [Paracraurococcus ruber]TDG32771.1 carboxylate-amine ligase [Paracraurococcus ruber]